MLRRDICSVSDTGVITIESTIFVLREIKVRRFTFRVITSHYNNEHIIYHLPLINKMHPCVFAFRKNGFWNLSWLTFIVHFASSASYFCFSC